MKGAKKQDLNCFDDGISQGDPKAKMAFRYKELCHLYSQLITRAADSEIAKQGLQKLLEQVDSNVQETTVEEFVSEWSVRIECWFGWKSSEV
ncbi:hypothetical protein BUALT_Bualt05G0108100 [Buddleja alternifolia]|uniref:Uncharacterized protein n=1 Tax=Buddleja alternifolia TaxID=168488 RepID=A0AAV6XJQ9_9LAMI|nr:hypothetical protein BUALT_Bualt05G0108100 [Buddleja alternifolia]